MNKEIFRLIIIVFFLVGSLNFAFADSGPIIGANQAKINAQNYLNSHSLPYKAVTPTEDAWQIKVKDSKTGQVKWVQFGVYKSDSPDFGGPGRYTAIKGQNDAWIVTVNDNNGKKVGVIYVDAQSGKVTTTDIKSPEKQNTNNITPDTDNATNQVPQETNNTIWVIVAIIAAIIIIGGYWIYRKR